MLNQVQHDKQKMKMKKTLLLTSLALSTIVFAQDKLLTIQEAVLKGRTISIPNDSWQ